MDNKAHLKTFTLPFITQIARCQLRQRVKPVPPVHEHHINCCFQAVIDDIVPQKSLDLDITAFFEFSKCDGEDALP